MHGGCACATVGAVNQQSASRYGGGAGVVLRAAKGQHGVACLDQIAAGALQLAGKGFITGLVYRQGVVANIEIRGAERRFHRTARQGTYRFVVLDDELAVAINSQIHAIADRVAACVIQGEDASRTRNTHQQLAARDFSDRGAGSDRAGEGGVTGLINGQPRTILVFCQNATSTAE